MADAPFRWVTDCARLDHLLVEVARAADGESDLLVDEGRSVVFTTRDGALLAHDLVTGQPRGQWPTGPGQSALCLSDGGEVLVAHEAGVVAIDPSTGASRQIARLEGAMRALGIDEGRRVALYARGVGYVDRDGYPYMQFDTLEVYRTSDGEQLVSETVYVDMARAWYDASGRVIAQTGHLGAELRAVFRDGRCATPQAFYGALSHQQIAPSGRLLCARQGQVIVCDEAGEAHGEPLPTGPSTASRVALSDDNGAYIITNRHANNVATLAWSFDLSTGALRGPAWLGVGDPVRMTHLRDGRLVTRQGETVRVFDLEKGLTARRRVAPSRSSLDAPVIGIRCSPHDGSLVAVSATGLLARFVDGACICTAEGPDPDAAGFTGPYHTLAFCDAGLLVAGQTRGARGRTTIARLDPTTLEPRWAHDAPDLSARVLPLGDVVLVPDSAARRALLLDASTGRERAWVTRCPESSGLLLGRWGQLPELRRPTCFDELRDIDRGRPLDAWLQPRGDTAALLTRAFPAATVSIVSLSDGRICDELPLSDVVAVLCRGPERLVIQRQGALAQVATGPGRPAVVAVTAEVQAQAATLVSEQRVLAVGSERAWLVSPDGDVLASLEGLPALHVGHEPLRAVGDRLVVPARHGLVVLEVAGGALRATTIDATPRAARLFGDRIVCIDADRVDVIDVVTGAAVASHRVRVPITTVALSPSRELVLGDIAGRVGSLGAV